MSNEHDWQETLIIVAFLLCMTALGIWGQP